MFQACFGHRELRILTRRSTRLRAGQGLPRLGPARPRAPRKWGRFSVRGRERPLDENSTPPDPKFKYLTQHKRHRKNCRANSINKKITQAIVVVVKVAPGATPGFCGVFQLATGRTWALRNPVRRRPRR